MIGVFMIGFLSSCAFAEVVNFESIKTKIDVLNWTYEENKEDATVVLHSPKKDSSITFKRSLVPDGANAESIAAGMMKDDKGHDLDKMSDSAYSYEYGNDSEAYMHVRNGELLVIKVEGSNDDTDKILSYIPQID